MWAEIKSPKDVMKGESVGHRVLRGQAKELEVLRSPERGARVVGIKRGLDGTIEPQERRGFQEEAGGMGDYV